MLALTKVKAFADDKFNIAKMITSVFDSEENIVEKGENAGYQHFLLVTSIFSFIHNLFKSFHYFGLLRSYMCDKGLNFSDVKKKKISEELVNHPYIRSLCCCCIGV